MSATMNRPPFDQNDKKYKCMCGNVHIRKAARIVAVLTNLAVLVEIIFSFTRNSTIVLYSLMSAAFTVVIFGSMLYGVWKEKRLYVVPYLLTQLISVCLTLFILLIFIISIAVHSDMVIRLAEDLGNVDPNVSQEDLDSALAVFTVIFILFLCLGAMIQAYFLDIIYSFHQFLKDRESSFSFNFDSTINYAPNSVFTSPSVDVHPPQYNSEQVEIPVYQ